MARLAAGKSSRNHWKKHMTGHMTTAATEAIRIAEKWLPGAPWRHQKELAQEIVAAINLCEAELGDELVVKLKALNNSL